MDQTSDQRAGEQIQELSKAQWILADNSQTEFPNMVHVNVSFRIITTVVTLKK